MTTLREKMLKVYESKKQVKKAPLIRINELNSEQSISRARAKKSARNALLPFHEGFPSTIQALNYLRNRGFEMDNGFWRRDNTCASVCRIKPKGAHISYWTTKENIWPLTPPDTTNLEKARPACWVEDF